MLCTVLFACGHEKRMDIIFPVEHEERFQNSGVIEQMEKYHCCPKCKHEALAQELLKKQAIENGLPELEGSEKQIAWAMKLRSDLLLMKDFLFTERTGRFIRRIRMKGCTIEEVQQTFEQAVEKILRTETSAKYYIDNADILQRSDVVSRLIKHSGLAMQDVELDD